MATPQFVAVAGVRSRVAGAIDHDVDLRMVASAIVKILHGAFVSKGVLVFSIRAAATEDIPGVSPARR
jgi:hypothetical protein